MNRRPMSTKRAARIFAAHGGICHICGQKIEGGREGWEAEHIIPLAMGGDDDDNNLAPAHVKCHKAKTREDVGHIAKAKRMEAKAIGAFRRRTPLPGGKRSLWKRKINGKVERR